MKSKSVLAQSKFRKTKTKLWKKFTRKCRGKMPIFVKRSRKYKGSALEAANQNLHML